MDGRSLCVALDLSSLQPASLASPPSLPGPPELPVPAARPTPGHLPVPLPAPRPPAASLAPDREPQSLSVSQDLAVQLPPSLAPVAPPSPAIKPGNWNIRAGLKALMVSTSIYISIQILDCMVSTGSAPGQRGSNRGQALCRGGATAPGGPSHSAWQCAASPGAGGGHPTLPHVGQASDCQCGTRRPSACLGASCCGQATGCTSTAPGANRGGR